MPYCKNCHQEIEKFDTDICPHCGQIRPIDPTYKTMDVTTTINTAKDLKYAPPKTKKQKTCALLCMLLGFSGAHNFYLSKPLRGLFEAIITLAVVCAIGFPLFFLAWPNPLAFILPFLAIWLYYLIQGIYFLKVECPKDGKGEFLR